MYFLSICVHRLALSLNRENACLPTCTTKTHHQNWSTRSTNRHVAFEFRRLIACFVWTCLGSMPQCVCVCISQIQTNANDKQKSFNFADRTFGHCWIFEFSFDLPISTLFWLSICSFPFFLLFFFFSFFFVSPPFLLPLLHPCWCVRLSFTIRGRCRD